MDTKLPETTIVDPTLKQASAPIVGGSKRIFFILGGVVLLLIILIGGGYYFVRMKAAPPPITNLPPPPKLGANLLLAADPMEATLGGQIKVTVLVKSDLDAANLFIAKLKFSNQLLQAKSINLRSESTSSGFIKDWFISNWVENTIDNNTGSVSLVGGVPNPGFQTQPDSSGSAMADVIFVAKAPGDATISFDDTSTVYRNSDNINILVSKKDVTVKITGELPITPTPVITNPPISATPSATLTPVLSPTPMPTLVITPTLTPALSPVPTSTPTGPPVGDVNQDGKVDFQDLSALLSLWGKKGAESLKADLNNDGVVNSFDYSKLTKILKDAGLVQ